MLVEWLNFAPRFGWANRCGWANWFDFINWFGWAELEGMMVYVPLLMLASLLLASIPLPASPLASYSKPRWRHSAMATLCRSKPQAHRLFGGFFIPVEFLQISYFSRCP